MNADMMDAFERLLNLLPEDRKRHVLEEAKKRIDASMRPEEVFLRDATIAAGAFRVFREWSDVNPQDPRLERVMGTMFGALDELGDWLERQPTTAPRFAEVVCGLRERAVHHTREGGGA